MADEDDGDYYDQHGARDDHDPFATEGEEGDAGEGDNNEEPDDIPEPPAVTKIRVTGADRTTGISGTTPMRSIMTRFEYARLIESYALMIDSGVAVDPRIEYKSDASLHIAKAALDFRAADYEFPIEVYRPIGDDREEVWRVSELILPHELTTYGL